MGKLGSPETLQCHKRLKNGIWNPENIPCRGRSALNPHKTDVSFVFPLFIRKMANPEMLQKAVKGDSQSITKIVRQYTPLVHRIVNKYAFMAQDHSREDLVQEGLMGIVRAIETFDFERGTEFMTWVYPQVRGAVQNFARKENRRWPKNALLAWDNREIAAPYICETIGEPIDSDFAGRVKEILTQCCGSTTSKRAQIVCARFGLLGKTALRQGEVAKEFNMTKQAVNSHISSFSKKVREKYPDLYQSVLGG